MLHTSFVSFVGNGIINQLKSEEVVTNKLGLDWDIVLVSSNKKFKNKHDFYYLIPSLFKNYFLKRLFYHIFLVKYIKKKKPNIILYRYLKADFFSFFFSSFYKNRVTIHHSIELDEIDDKRLKGKLLKWVERSFGNRFLSKSKAIIAMTHEILEHELLRSNPNLPSLVLPNGIDYNSFFCVDDKRNSEINVVFMASQFHIWHGLDLLIELLEKNENNIKFHLIGNVNQILLNKIMNNEKVKSSITLHGYLERHEVEKVLSICDIGIDSLALFRKNMSSACSLKTREYLASGIPVFSSSKDAGLPDSFSYYRVEKLTLEAINNFAIQSKHFTRKEVRENSKAYIDKEVLTIRLNNFLKNL